MSNWLPIIRKSPPKDIAIAAFITFLLASLVLVLIWSFGGLPTAWEWLKNDQNRVLLLFLLAVLSAIFLAILVLIQIYRAGDRAETSPAKQNPDYTVRSIPPVEDIVITIVEPDFELQVFVQKFCKAQEGERSFDGWKEDRNHCVKLSPRAGHFQVLKKELADNGFQNGDPYKFFCRVSNHDDEVDRTYAILCKAEYVVTGKGEEDPDDHRYYRVWFLSGREPILAESKSIYFYNHEFRYNK